MGTLSKRYELMFRLAFEDFSAGVLDCGGGPASFTAELSASGILGDLGRSYLYVFSGLEIQGRFEAVVEPMLSQIRATPGNWTWTYHRDPDDLCANRRAALRRFLADYDEGIAQAPLHRGRIPFSAFRFGFIWSRGLFPPALGYSDLLSDAFHIRSAKELCRVARESTLLSAFDTTR